MVSKQDAVVNLSRLLRSDPHSLGEITSSGQYLPDASLQGDDFEVHKPLNYHLEIRSVGDGDFLLRGTVRGEVLMSCRCLKPLGQLVGNRRIRGYVPDRRLGPASGG